MKMTENEKKLLELARKLESPKSRDDLVYQAETMVRAQEALRQDYGLVGVDTPLFNGLKDTARDEYLRGLQNGRNMAEGALNA